MLTLQRLLSLLSYAITYPDAEEVASQPTIHGAIFARIPLSAMIIHNQPVAQAGLPLDKASKAVIMLHGRGDRADNFLSLSQELPQHDTAYLALQAIHNTWYPYSFMAPVEKNEPQLSLSLSAIHELVDNLEGLGFSSSQLYFLGFSQGACLSLEYSARYARPYGGVIALTGGLLGETINVSNYQGDFEQTPIFMGSSDHDPHVPEERINESEVILKGMKADIQKKIYPELGHSINDDELRIARQLLSNSTFD